MIVVGGGHAGAEAAHASARLGARTLLITTSLDTIGQMSCNPAIGGVGKGQIVREIDALGGLMGRVADATAVHFRMLNTSKGAAVWSPRCQSDRREYAAMLRWELENTPGLCFRQDGVTDLLTERAGGPETHAPHTGDRQPGSGQRIAGVVTRSGAEFLARAPVLLRVVRVRHAAVSVPGVRDGGEEATRLEAFDEEDSRMLLGSHAPARRKLSGTVSGVNRPANRRLVHWVSDVCGTWVCRPEHPLTKSEGVVLA